MISVNVETNQDTLAACCYSLGGTNAYMRGAYAPHYPLPVVNTMRDEYGMSHSACRWMENFDGFWTDEHGARGFSL
jgi:hypothetical protein